MKRKINKDTRRTTPVDAIVGKAVRAKRITLGMSQTALAQSCGITFQQIQKYENGANRVSASRLWQFAAVLNEPITFFFEGLGEPKLDQRAIKTKTKEEHKIDDETNKIARQIASIEDAGMKKKLKAMISALAAK